MNKQKLHATSMSAAIFAFALFFSGCQKDQLANSRQNKNGLTESAAKAKDQSPATNDDAAFDAEIETVMHDFITRMENMQMSCEPDVTFARMQTMHHQMGIAMAEVALKYEHHKQAIRLTEKSRDANLKSIERLRRCLQQHRTNINLSAEQCTAFQKQMKDELVSMKQELENALHSVRDRNDVDMDFSELIIEHHKGAIAMSQMELEYGHDKCIRTEAGKLVDEQAKELEDFSEFKNDHIYGRL